MSVSRLVPALALEPTGLEGSGWGSVMQACGQCLLAPIHLKPGAPPVITTTDVFIPRLVSPERPLVQHWTVPYQDTYGPLLALPLQTGFHP